VAQKSRASQLQVEPSLTLTAAPSFALRRKCACGNRPAGYDDKCDECRGFGPSVMRKAAPEAGGAEGSASSVNAPLQPAAAASTVVPLSEPGDREEREADAASELVMRWLTTSPSASPPEEPRAQPLSGQIPLRVQRALGEDRATGGLIVDDDAVTLTTGQMRKTEFLRALRVEACLAADRALAEAGRSTRGCPYVEKWLGLYARREASHLERAIRKYAPESAQARSAREYVPIASARVARGAAEWARTGQLPEVPEELRAAMFGGGVVGVLASVASAVGSAVSAVGRLFAKPSAGAPAGGVDRAALEARLGPGRPLETSARMRMESAFGRDFGGVRIHTDNEGRDLSRDLSARAFTVGQHVAFGAEQYRPGTLIGDALLAHELAHVVQQGGGSAGAPLREGVEGSAGDDHELDADQAAAGALIHLHGQGGSGRRRPPQGRSLVQRLTSGPSLQRCGSEDKLPETDPKNQRAGTGLPTREKQGELLATLNKVPPKNEPDPVTGIVEPDIPAATEEVKKAQEKWDGTFVDTGDAAADAVTNAPAQQKRDQLKAELRRTLDDWMKENKPYIDNAAALDAARKPISAFEKPCEAAKTVVDRHFRGWISSAALAPEHKKVRDKFTFRAADSADGKQNLFDAADKAALTALNVDMTPEWRIEKALSAPAGAQIMKSHSFQPSRTDQERKFFREQIRSGLASEDPERAKRLVLFSQYFIARTLDPEHIMIQTYDSPWSAFETCTHEYLHSITHPRFTSAAGGEKSMFEGFTELFTVEAIEKVYGDMPDDIEKLVTAGDASVGPHPERYKTPDDYQGYLDVAKKIRGQLGSPKPKGGSCSGGTYAPGGFNAIKAAYFQGHVELLGLTPAGTPGPTQQSPDQISVPPGVKNVSELALATGVSAAEIARVNGIAESANLTPNQQLRVPGYHDHVVVTDVDETPASGGAAPATRAESIEQIARMNDVTVADIKRANPGVNFSALSAGQRILIGVPPAPSKAQGK
jgi:LysM repeat protein